MERGIGRAGFQLLALVFFVIGMGGLAAAWTAIAVEFSTVFQYVGLATAAVGLLLLVTMTLLVSMDRLESWDDEWDEEPARSAAPSTPPVPAKQATPPATPPAVPEASSPVRLDVEFADAEPAARATPDRLVLPKAFQEEPPAGAPGAGAQGARPPAVATPMAPSQGGRPDGRPDLAGPEARRAMREKYTANAPTMRALMDGPTDRSTKDVPMVRAERCPPDVDADWMPDGKTRGKCGRCATVILAPTARPIRLRCPQCGTEKLLE